MEENLSGTLVSITIVGRLTRDAELKYLSSGEPVGKFTLATDSRVKKDGQYVDEASFWDVDFWGKRAEAVNQYLTKGKPVAVTGEGRIEKWEKDGQIRMKVCVNAQSVALLPLAPSKVDNASAKEPGDDVPF